MAAETSTAWWKRGKNRTRTDREMSIAEHLQELRRRVIISLIAVVVGALVAFMWYTQSIGPIPSLGDILREPYCKVPPEQRMAIDAGECRLLATGPFDMFMLRLKVSFLVGLVFASPVWLAQLWGFITPGLMDNERKWSRRFVGSAVFLFVLGTILAYIVLAVGLSFLLTLGGDTQTAALTGERYFNFLLGMLLVFGVSFEIPLLIVMLNQAGLLAYESIKDKRRAIIMAIFVFAAVITPGQDPVGMTVLATCLVVLVEFALQICRLHDRRQKEERPEWLDLDDEQASPMDLTPGSTDAPEQIEAPGAVGASGAISSGAIGSSGAVTSSGAIGSSGAVTSSGAITPDPVARPSSTLGPGTQSQSDGQQTRPAPVQASNWDDIT